MSSLTRVDAQRRAALIAVRSYDVELDLTTGEDTFDSRTTIRFTASDTAASTFLDVRPRQLRGAVLNGRPLDAGVADGRIALTGLAADNELVVDAVMAYSHDGEGLHRHVDPADGKTYLYAMSFLDAAPRWFACFDQPDLKAPVTLRVTCPPDWIIAGNGAAIQHARGRWELATAQPLSTYFTTLVAGPYNSVTSAHDGIPLAIHARASLAEHLDRDADELFTITRDCLDEFHRLFGVRYPWGAYHQAFVPEFNAGAMENPGCVTFRDPMIFRSRVTNADRSQRASTIAHEMAHMWFGDLVTMRWWDDLWLNESFAEYLGQRVCNDVTEYDSWVEFGIQRKAWGYTADRRPSTHPVAGNGAADAASALSDFDGISYAKGAAVLRQLATNLGDEVFLSGLRRYFDTHAYGNAEFADLIGSWTDAGARDLGTWADAWLRTSGLDTLAVTSVEGGVQLRRSGPAGTASMRPHAISVASFDGGGRELEREAITVRDDVTALGNGCTDAALVLPDAADETWAKIALHESEWRGMAPTLAGIADPLGRTVIWNALRVAVTDADLDPALALEVPLTALEHEPLDAIITHVLRWTTDILVGNYLPDELRPDALARVAGTVDHIVRAAPAGSGRQLAAARGLIKAWSDVDGLRRWLAGDDLPAGVVVDDELRWALLERLSALGGITIDDIDREAARDRTTQGAVHAAHCRAALPDPAAKRSAWQILMTDPTRSNYELYAMAGAFWQPSQTELTQPFVARYFDEIHGTAAIRSGWVVARLAEYAYPSTAIRRDTIRRTEALLARADLDEHIRRSVIDAGDDLRRAVRSREKFAR